MQILIIPGSKHIKSDKKSATYLSLMLHMEHCYQDDDDLDGGDNIGDMKSTKTNDEPGHQSYQ